MKFLTRAVYFLSAIATIVISFSLIIAIARDPYSRGNKMFHDRTMNFLQQTKSSSLSYESSTRVPHLKFGDSMLTPPLFNNVEGDNKSKPIKFFWGIMSTLSDKDKIQRSVIRQTYLSYYKNSDSPHRICSYNAYRANIAVREECEMIYAFVVGGDDTDDAPKDLVDEAPNRSPLTIEHPSVSVDGEEDDLVYLNIKENQFEGKMQSYFKWVHTLIADRTLSVDYIAKVDSDTILFPPQWFSFVESDLLPAPYNRRIYGGILLDRLECGGLRKWHCRQMVNLNYMSGQMYFMTPDLAAFIVSDGYGAEVRQRNQYFTEDLTIGNFVHSYPHGPIHQVVITEEYSLWEHGDTLKDPINFLRRWDEVKDSWNLEPLSDETVDTHTYGDIGTDDNIKEDYARFSEERWKLRALLDELYRDIFVIEHKGWSKLCGYVRKINLP